MIKLIKGGPPVQEILFCQPVNKQIIRVIRGSRSVSLCVHPRLNDDSRAGVAHYLFTSLKLFLVFWNLDFLPCKPGVWP